MINKNIYIKRIIRAIALFCLFFQTAQFQIVSADTSSTRRLNQPAKSNKKQTTPLWKRIFDEIKAKAESGDAYAQAVLADRYMNGMGTHQNFSESLKWAEKSYLQNNHIGGYVLAFLYLNGNGVKMDLTKAKAIFSNIFSGIVIMTETKDPLAMNAYGLLYSIGEIVEKDRK